jgi:hypothetical protein
MPVTGRVLEQAIVQPNWVLMAIEDSCGTDDGRREERIAVGIRGRDLDRFTTEQESGLDGKPVLLVERDFGQECVALELLKFPFEPRRISVVPPLSRSVHV